MNQVLSCKCGDCLHWEVVQHRAEGERHAAVQPTQFLKCKTCGELYNVSIEVDPHENLEWVPVAEV